MIERVPVNSELANRIFEWKRLRPEWDVTALVAPDRKTVIFLAFRR